ncbi:hypothetical protein [Vibrio algivorus]|uniref:DUF1496 domain-containing protein n=1 Tax=Vibrio algivorus TaxID=1667024 RepID=A0A557NTJ0_9VIBR|nr:hypothetical protein [Vibrio algivorus]TVO31739.1 hypothetical protein FOF44_17760 [Vibrio algivorus]
MKIQATLLFMASLYVLTPISAFAQGGSLGGSNIEMCQSGAIKCGYPASHKSYKSEKPTEKESKPKAETTQQESNKIKSSVTKVEVNEH